MTTVKDGAEATVEDARPSASHVASPEPPPGFVYHPAANLFPLMDGAEFDELVADIKANGQRDSIKRLDGLLLDGRNRLLACIAAGKEPRIEDITLATSPTEYVVSVNLRRRHLTPAQRAALAVEIAEHLAVEAKHKQQAAGVHGAQGGRGKKASETLGDESSPTAGQKKEEAKSTTRAAQAAGAGVTATKKLAHIKKKAPDVFAQAKAGALSVAEAERIVNRAEGKTKSTRPTKNSQAFHLAVGEERDLRFGATPVLLVIAKVVNASGKDVPGATATVMILERKL